MLLNSDAMPTTSRKYNTDTIPILFIIAILLLAFSDVLTTHIVISGGGYEINPIMALIVHSVPLMCIVKVIAISAMVALSRYANTILPGANLYVLSACCIMGIIPVVNNILVML